MSKILFSPIGNVDPMSQKKNSDDSILIYDGPMLHICRHYKPDIVYLYLSQGMIDKGKQKECEDSLNLLGEEINHNFQVKPLIMKDVTNPQDYDEIFKSFEKEISTIRDNMTDKDELMFNLSSGTPAMNSALHVIAVTANYKILPIQVKIPDKLRQDKREDKGEEKREDKREDKRDIVKKLWQNNKDNFEESEGRTAKVVVTNINTRIKKRIIIEHIHKYNYSAAFDVASNIHPQAISQTALDFLELAVARVQLRTDTVLEKQKTIGIEIIPVDDKEKNKVSEKVKVSEYALAMDIKREHKEYGDYVRALSPLLVNLLILILNERFGIDIKKCCDEEDGLQWSREKMNEYEKGKPINKILNIFKENSNEEEQSKQEQSKPAQLYVTSIQLYKIWLILILNERFGIDIKKYCDEKDGLQWSREKMNKDEKGKHINKILNIFKENSNEEEQSKQEQSKSAQLYVTPRQLYRIWLKENGGKKLAEHIDKLITVEKTVRNKAAHEIVAITDHNLKDFCGYDINAIRQSIGNLLMEANIIKDVNNYWIPSKKNKKNKQRGIYYQMNKNIEEELLK